MPLSAATTRYGSSGSWRRTRRGGTFGFAKGSLQRASLSGLHRGEVVLDRPARFEVHVVGEPGCIGSKEVLYTFYRDALAGDAIVEIDLGYERDLPPSPPIDRQGPEDAGARVAASDRAELHRAAPAIQVLDEPALLVVERGALGQRDRRPRRASRRQRRGDLRLDPEPGEKPGDAVDHRHAEV